MDLRETIRTLGGGLAFTRVSTRPPETVRGCVKSNIVVSSIIELSSKLFATVRTLGGQYSRIVSESSGWIIHWGLFVWLSQPQGEKLFATVRSGNGAPVRTVSAVGAAGCCIFGCRCVECSRRFAVGSVPFEPPMRSPSASRGIESAAGGPPCLELQPVVLDHVVDGLEPIGPDCPV